MVTNGILIAIGVTHYATSTGITKFYYAIVSDVNPRPTIKCKQDRFSL